MAESIAQSMTLALVLRLTDRRKQGKVLYSAPYSI